MTERLSAITSTATSPVFNPTTDFTVQAEIPVGSLATIVVEGQVDDAAPWVRLGTINARLDPPMLRFAKCPNVRLALNNNTDLKLIKAWSGE